MIDRRWLVLVVLVCAVACSKKKATPGTGSSASGSGTAIDAAPVAPAVIDPLPGAVWSTPVPPYRLSSPPVALWADDKRVIAVTNTHHYVRAHSIELATGAVMSGTAIEVKREP